MYVTGFIYRTKNRNRDDRQTSINLQSDMSFEDVKESATKFALTQLNFHNILFFCFFSQCWSATVSMFSACAAP